MLYQISRLLTSQSYQHWASTEFFSFGWFFTIGIVTISYFFWAKVVDKSRLGQLVLLGIFSAIGFLIAEIITIGFYGVIEYNVRLLPLFPPLFTVSFTLAPLIFMLVLQYTATWNNYVFWAAIGSALLAFVLLPFYSFTAILQFHNWNYFFEFLLLLTNGILARALLLLVMNVEQSQPSSSRVCEIFPIVQPAATKPLHKAKNGKSDNDR